MIWDVNISVEYILNNILNIVKLIINIMLRFLIL
jgi:hypothetical protein